MSMPAAAPLQLVWEGADIDGIRGQPVDEEILDRSETPQHLVKDPHQRREIGAVGPAVDEVLEAVTIARRIEATASSMRPACS